MEKRKTLQELTIKDNFMFAAVMMDPENCRRFLELALEIPLERVEVSYEKSIVYHPEYKGIRLDVFARDEENTYYNVEMQVARDALEQRSRYYHSQMDMEQLLNVTAYAELPDVYVIFICDFDPLGGRKYRYTMEHVCREVPELPYRDGSHTLFLSTCGENEDEVPEALVKFLRYVKGVLADFGDPFVKMLEESVRQVKASREMEERFMVLQEMMKQERREGREEGIAIGKIQGKAEGKAEGRAEGKAESVLDILEESGSVPEKLRARILAETDMNVIRGWLRLAVACDSAEQFAEKIFCRP
ncbi:MAG: Rpn family recombination-promoting nuclease/putative transposase [Lachnospiraceae bacterium]|nr:Rpn family recombination-promoting nuclease/putative transposase [Lachnospiraceae bacterium]